MNAIPCFQVDAFTDEPFTGNPAAVCLLTQVGAEASWMQQVAAEMNLAETAFLRPLDEPDFYELRWFTPEIEVDLCGHATLASAFVLWNQGVVSEERELRFQTRSGILTASLRDGAIELNFPSSPPQQHALTEGVLEALGLAGPPTYSGRAGWVELIVVESADEVRGLAPDFRQLKSLPIQCALVTAPSDQDGVDFISRFFAPGAGIDEDPVTGSAHCVLGPYWAERLGKNPLIGFQASKRGGTVRVRVLGERTVLGGQAVLVWKGELVQ